VKHLLQQLENYRSQRNNRDVRPAWVTRFVNDAAQLFEPLDEVGRVGFDCQLTDDGWEVALYLGSLEIVGGREDGQYRYGCFHFDLHALLGLFRHVDDLQFATFPADDEGEGTVRTVVTLDGIIEQDRLRVRVHSTPPAEVGPGLRRYADGRCHPV